MILLYTGALAPDQPQPQASQSLGGFISSSLVQNGSINNLFPDLSIDDLRSGKIYTRMIVLKNTSGAIKTLLSIYTEFISDDFEIKIAGMLPALDTSCNRYYFEQLLNGNSIPFQATLDVREESNPITAADIAVNGMIGIWISLSKKISTTTTTTISPCSIEAVTVLRNNVDPIKTTPFSLKINYT